MLQPEALEMDWRKVMIELSSYVSQCIGYAGGTRLSERYCSVWLFMAAVW